MKVKFGEHKISLLTRIFGITPDTVRLYEKKGLLKPAKGENNYRIFSRSDFFDMAYILRLKEMGFSLQEIGEIASEADLEIIIEKTEQHLKEIEEAKRALARSQNVAENFLEDIKEIRSNGTKFELIEDASILKLEIEGTIVEARHIFDSLCLDEVPRLTVVIPDVMETDLMNPDIRENSEIIYTLVTRERDFSEELRKLKLSPELSSHIEIMPRQKYVRGITLTKPGRDYPLGTSFTEVFSSLGVLPSGPAMSRILYSKLVGDELVDYYETWIPVK